MSCQNPRNQPAVPRPPPCDPPPGYVQPPPPCMTFDQWIVQSPQPQYALSPTGFGRVDSDDHPYTTTLQPTWNGRYMWIRNDIDMIRPHLTPDQYNILRVMLQRYHAENNRCEDFNYRFRRVPRRLWQPRDIIYIPIEGQAPARIPNPACYRPAPAA